MWNCLGAVYQHGNVPAVRERDDLVDGIHGAEGIGNVRNGDDTGLRSKKFFVLLKKELSPIADRHDTEPGPLLLAKDLPRNDIGMVFHLGDEDLITRPDMLAAKAGGYQIDTFRRAPHEDNLTGLSRIDELLHLDTRILVGPCGSFAQSVHSAVDV